MPREAVDYRIAVNGHFVRSPCSAYVAQDCQHGERPGEVEVFGQNGEWLCRACTAVLWPELAAKVEQVYLTNLAGDHAAFEAAFADAGLDPQDMEWVWMDDEGRDFQIGQALMIAGLDA